MPLSRRPTFANLAPILKVPGTRGCHREGPPGRAVEMRDSNATTQIEIDWSTSRPFARSQGSGPWPRKGLDVTSNRADSSDRQLTPATAVSSSDQFVRISGPTGSR
jgi:hypothetical protein